MPEYVVAARLVSLITEMPLSQFIEKALTDILSVFKNSGSKSDRKKHRRRAIMWNAVTIRAGTIGQAGFSNVWRVSAES